MEAAVDAAVAADAVEAEAAACAAARRCGLLCMWRWSEASLLQVTLHTVHMRAVLAGCMVAASGEVTRNAWSGRQCVRVRECD